MSLSCAADLQNKEGRYSHSLSSKLCRFSGCTKHASFNYPGASTRLYCAAHKHAGMINLNAKSCNFDGCRTRPSFNHAGQQRPLFCSIHKHPDMVYVVGRHCRFSGCTKHPSFSYPGASTRLYCAAHAPPGMTNLDSKLCQFDGCRIQASFNHAGEHRPLFCLLHKKPDMVDILGRRCNFDGCRTRPSFNHAGQQRPLFCSIHKHPNMVDVVSRHCRFSGCTKHASFNYPGASTRLYCAAHAPPGMVSVASKCEYPGCEARPIFKRSDEKTASFCKQHKSEEMVRTKLEKKKKWEPKMCDHQGCTSIGRYRDPNNKTERYCRSHKSDFMVNIKSERTCTEDNCNSVASYGLPHHPKTKCARHREVGMILRPRRRCLEDMCLELATMGEIGRPALWCKDHCPNDDYVNLFEQQCASCGLQFVLDANGLCEYCNKIGSTNVKHSKQLEVEKHLQCNAQWLWKDIVAVDKRVPGACDRERPDFLFDFGSKYLIIECDENQHSHISRPCEDLRMFNIGQSLGGVPVVFVRFNPDRYKNADGTHGTISKKKRMAKLVDVAKHIKTEWEPDEPDQLVFAVYMYYNGAQSFDIKPVKPFL